MTTKDTYGMIINGRKVTTGSVVDVINPANEAVFATVARANVATIDEAVAAARPGLLGVGRDTLLRARGDYAEDRRRAHRSCR